VAIQARRACRIESDWGLLLECRTVGTKTWRHQWGSEDRRGKRNFFACWRCFAHSSGRFSAAKGCAGGARPEKPIDGEYTRRSREYTTQPFFASPLVDYLPASRRCQLQAVSGTWRERPDLPYSQQFTLLQDAGKSVASSESLLHRPYGRRREMIAVAVSSETNLAHRGERARLSSSLTRAPSKTGRRRSDRLMMRGPGLLNHGTFTRRKPAAPTALMELAYRLAVDESSYIKDIRNNLITLDYDADCRSRWP